MVSFSWLIVLLLGATIVAILSNKSKVPYTVALLVFGIVLGILSSLLPALGGLSAGGLLSSDVFFGLLLPPIVYEGALHVDMRLLRKRGVMVLSLTFLGTMVTILLAGYLVSLALGIGLLLALLISSILSPTDPVGIIDLFKRLKAPEELSSMVEMESLLNDAVGIVAFATVLKLMGGSQFSPLGVLQGMILLMLGGILVGLAISAGGYVLHSKIDDPNVETGISIALAYGSFHLASALGFSGIVATIVTGVMTGTWIVPKTVKEETKTALFSFWRVIVYVVNSLVFIAMGLSANVSMVASILPFVGVVLLFLTASRAIFVYAHLPLSKVIGHEWLGMPKQWYSIIVLSGMRGAVPIVLSLTLYGSSTAADFVISIVIGVALLSIILQTLASNWFVTRSFSSSLSSSSESTTHDSEPTFRCYRIKRARACFWPLTTYQSSDLRVAWS